MNYAYLKYRLLNLPTAKEIFPSAVSDADFSRVAQKTYVGKYYIYAVLYFGINATTIICRGKKPEDPSDNKVDFHNGDDKMVLEHFGHTQTMEFFEHDDKTYFWIGTKASNNPKYHWATQLARLQYSSGQKYYKNTDVQRISSIISATPNGDAHGNGVLERFDAALSDNGHLLIASQDTAGETCMTVYDNQAVNNALDGNKMISADTLTDCLAINSDENGFTTNLQNSDFIPYKSVQGFEISNGNAIYITSGDMGRTPTISKILWNGTNNETLYFKNKYWGGKNTETEAVQISGKNLYMTVSYHNGGYDNAVSGNNIYQIAKTDFSIRG